MENASMVIIGVQNSPSVDFMRTVPTIGPVHENDTEISRTCLISVRDKNNKCNATIVIKQDDNGIRTYHRENTILESDEDIRELASTYSRISRNLILGDARNHEFSGTSIVDSYSTRIGGEDLTFNASDGITDLSPIKDAITEIPGGLYIILNSKLSDISPLLDFDVNPTDESAGRRKVRFGKHLYIDGSDFSLDPPPKYFRLKPDGYVRLKNAYIIRCDEVVQNEDGEVEEVLCSYVPESHSGHDTSGIKVKGVIQWVNADDCAEAEVRRYESLLRDAEYAGQDFSERMNPDSEKIVAAKAEPYLAQAEEGMAFQLLRTGYFKKCTEGGKLVLSEIVSLKDNFNKPRT